MRLHEGLHSERPRKAEEVRERRVVQHRRDQQNGVRARGARGGHLVARRDEVLVEDRDLRIAAHVRQIAFVAEETVRLAQDRERRRPRVRELARELDRTEVLADHPFARAGALQFRNDVHALARECGGEVAHRRRVRRPAHHFRERDRRLAGLRVGTPQGRELFEDVVRRFHLIASSMASSLAVARPASMDSVASWSASL